MSDKFDDRMRAAFEGMFQREMDKTFGAAQSNAVPSESALNVREVLRAANIALRVARRTQITFIVDRGHQGPPLRYETPNDGERIELSWADANAVHEVWPLKLHTVLSEDAAEFVPAIVGELVGKHLDEPPYHVPPEESLEDWLKG